MAQPICIITAGGLKCAASKVKQHFPVGHSCKVLSEALLKKYSNRLNKWLKVTAKAAAPPAKGSKRVKLARKPDVFTRVVEIMLAAGVKDDTPFTIVMAPKP